MLEKQQLVLDHDDKGTVHLYNTYNIAEEAELAAELAHAGNNTVKLGDGLEVKPMGYIPTEMWLYDPWLIEANKARAAGDMGEYTRMVNKFFEIHTRFKAIGRQKYFTTR